MYISISLIKMLVCSEQTGTGIHRQLMSCPRKQNPVLENKKRVLENKNNLPSQATRLALFCGAFLLLSQKWISKQGEQIV